MKLNKIKISEVATKARHFLKGLPSGKHRHIGVLGDYGLDCYKIGEVNRVSPEAPIPILLENSTYFRPGCAANVVANLQALSSSFGYNTHVFGVVGDDYNASMLVDIIQKGSRKVKIQLIKSNKRPTTLKTRFIASGQQLLRVDSETTLPINSKLIFENISLIEKHAPKLSCLIIQDYGKGGLPEELLQATFKIAKANNVLTVVDPNPRTPINYYNGANVIKANVNEAEALLRKSLNRDSSGRVGPGACIELMEKIGANISFITEGKYGMVCADHVGTITKLPSFAREVFDVTGAGDTVVSVLSACLTYGCNLPQSALIASAAAGVVVTKIGTAVVSVSEILNELERFSKS
jgi:rfaE bifunctional protein kinase chain/domain